MCELFLKIIPEFDGGQARLAPASLARFSAFFNNFKFFFSANSCNLKFFSNTKNALENLIINFRKSQKLICAISILWILWIPVITTKSISSTEPIFTILGYASFIFWTITMGTTRFLRICTTISTEYTLEFYISFGAFHKFFLVDYSPNIKSRKQNI